MQSNHRVTSSALALAAVALFSAVPPAFGQTANVLTQHNDNSRTGANLSETVLNTTTVRSDRFRLLFYRTVDGQIAAQPLYVSNLEIPGKGIRNVVYVATMRNRIYAFDADDPTSTIWAATLGTPVNFDFMPLSYSLIFTRIIIQNDTYTIFDAKPPVVPPKVPPGQYNIYPHIGITSTPVIDSVGGTIYLVAKEADSGTVRHQLYALDLATGRQRPGSPVLIKASVPGIGTGNKAGVVALNSEHHLQRAALLLSKGRVYVAFGSHQDTPPFHGWILAYDARTLQQKAVLCTTPDGFGGGIWQAGNGPAADDEGNLYVMTGNGTFDGNKARRGWANSVVKLRSDLSVADYFTPENFQHLSNDDVDLGASGPMLLPGNLLVGGGKDGRFFLLDRSRLGGLQSSTAQPRQVFQASTPPILINIVGFDYHHIHGSPVFWTSPRDGGLVYVWPERDWLRAYQFDVSTRRFPLRKTIVKPDGRRIIIPDYQSTMTSPPHSMPGGMLSLSANGGAGGTGIVWASLPMKGDALVNRVGGILRAFDAADIGRELWNSQQYMAPRDGVGNFAKGSPPTVANGKVYLATFSGRLNVYGLVQHAQYISQTGLPATLLPRQSINVAMTFRNAGGSKWTSATNYALGSQNLQDNSTWGFGRVGLPHDVPSNGRVTFNFIVTAPAAEGTYRFQWKMLRENVEWFGDLSPLLVRNVTNPACGPIRSEMTTLKSQLAGLQRQKAALDPKRDMEIILEINEQIAAVEGQITPLKQRANELLCRL